MLVQIEHPHDAGMIELARDRELPAEALGDGRFLGQVGMQYLHRHFAPGHAVPSRKDFREAASAEPACQLESRGEDGTRRELGHQPFLAACSASRRRSVLPLDSSRRSAAYDQWYSAHPG